MKKFILLLIFPALIFCFSCRQKIETIPEITASLTDETIYELKSETSPAALIENNKELLLLSLKGELFRLDAEKKTLAALLNCGTDIEAGIFRQGGFAVLKQQGAENYILLNLSKGQIAKKIENTEIGRVIGIDSRLLVFELKNELIFFDYAAGKIETKVALEKDEQLFNCEFSGSLAAVLSTRKLYIKRRGGVSIETRQLRNGSVSGFLLDGKFIYFGSAERELVKLSIGSGKSKWRVKLPVLLKFRPYKAGKYILITPEDNNIYFFNGSGSLRWWRSFDSPQAFPAVVMEKNAAVFLMNREFRWKNNKIRFYNYKKKDVVSYKFKYSIESAPVYLEDYIYVLCRDEDKESNYIARIGNKYDVAIEIDPEKVKALGKSIEFTLKPINLIEPGAKVTIFDAGEKSVFSKEIVAGAELDFVWMPEKTGRYKLTASINAKNKQGIEVKKSFRVIDVDKIVKQYYFELQQECPREFPKAKAAAAEDKAKSKKKKKKGKKKNRKKK
ncbi:MAG: hypothetical protein KAW12_23390 [Candidatus Aminicenantes bacterium]|nr:hypothetical protein [Candidatus Aminicenantes bacterium]